MSHISSGRVVFIGLVRVSEEKTLNGVTSSFYGKVPVIRIVETETSSSFLYKGHDIKKLGQWTSPGYAIDEAKSYAERLGLEKDSEGEIVVNSKVITKSYVLSKPMPFDSVPQADMSHPLRNALISMDGHSTEEQDFSVVWSSRKTETENTEDENKLKALCFDIGKTPYQAMEEIRKFFEQQTA